MEEGAEEAGGGTASMAAAVGVREESRGSSGTARLGWLGLARLGAGPAQSAEKI